MLSFSRFFLILSLSVFSQLSLAKSVILHIAYTDEIAITTSGVNALNQWLGDQYPDKTIVSITESARRFGYFTKFGENKVRARMIEKIKRLEFGDGDNIDMLIISTHGSTKNGNTTSLSLVGDISEEDLDANAKEFFSPIVSHMSLKANVIIESCSTMCGETKSAVQRSLNLLKYLKISEGSLFGATTPLQPLLSLNLSWKWMFIVGILSLGGAEAGVIYDFVANPDLLRGLTSEATQWQFGIHFLKNFVISASTVTFSWTMAPVLSAFRETLGYINKGQIIKVSRDSEIEINEVKYNFEREKVFELNSCRNVLN